MMSLQQRLNRGLILILCIILFLQWLVTDKMISAVIEKQIAIHLNHDSDSILTTLKLNSNNQLSVDSFHIEEVYNQAFSGQYYVLVIDKKLYYSKSLQNVPLKIKHLGVGETMLYHLDDGPKHQSLLVLGRTLNLLGHEVSITVAEDLTAVHEDILHIRFMALLN